MKKRVIILVIYLFTLAGMALAQKMTVKDSDANILMEVNDEGAVGSIMLPQGSTPGVTTNKLYNVGGSLYWNGSALGLAGSAGGWTDGGTNVYLTTSTDKVGIGTNSPRKSLHIRDISNGATVRLQGPANPGTETLSTIEFTENDAGFRFAHDPDDNRLYLEMSPSVTWEKIMSWERNSGNIGIGTTDPDAALEVVCSDAPVLRSIRTSSVTNDHLTTFAGLAKTSGDMADWFGSLIVFQIQDNTTGPNNIAYISARRQGDDNSGILTFETFNSGSHGIRMTIDKVGNVGIGTTSPNSKLDVNGTAEMTGFKLTTGATDGYVLTSDASGVGTWQAASGSVLWESGTNGVYEDDAGVIVGIDQAETLSNGGFSLAAGDLFVQDQLGVEGNVYTDGSFIAGSSLTLADGSVTQSTGSALNINLGGAVGDDFIVDTNTLVVESDNHRVGIGTTSPAQKLNVDGSFLLDGSFYFPNNPGSGYRYGRIRQGDFSGGHYPSHAEVNFDYMDYNNSSRAGLNFVIGGSNDGFLTLTTNNTERVRVDHTGNLGIGRTSPNSKLDVNGTAEMTGFKMPTGASDGYVLTSDASGVGTWQAASGSHWESGTNGVYEDDAGVIVGIDQAETLENSGFSLAAGDLFVEDQLGVEGNVYTDGSFVAGSSLTLTDGSITQATGSALNVNLGGAAGDDFMVDTNTLVVDSENNRVGIGTTEPGARLQVKGDGTNLTAKFTDLAETGGKEVVIDNNGNVGIGTTSTDVKLTVSGERLGINVDTVFPYQGIIQINNPSIASTSEAGIGFATGFSGDFGDQFGVSGSNSSLWIIGPGVGGAVDKEDFSFYERWINGTAGAQRLILKSGGNVGIGTTSPAQKLDVAGTIQMTGFKMPTSASDGYVLTSDASGVGTWQETSSGDTDWTISGSDMYSAVSGNVGIGTTAPNEKLVVQDGNFYIKNGNSHLRGVTGGARIEYHHDYGLDGSESYCEVAIQGIGTGDDALVVEAYRINGNGVGYGAAMGKQVWVMSCEAAGSTSPETIEEYPGEYDESSSDNISLTGEIGPILRVRFYKRYAYDNGNLMILLYGRFNPENAVFTATDY